MRKLVASFFISLDGVVEAPERRSFSAFDQFGHVDSHLVNH